VTNTDLRDVKLPHSLVCPTISAEFVWDGDAPRSFPVSGDAQSASAQRLGSTWRLRRPGSFSRFPLQPDNYTIDLLRGINGPGQYAKEITCGGRSVLHGTAPLGGAISCGALRFVIGMTAAL
jgi:hypothetical protein